MNNTTDRKLSGVNILKPHIALNVRDVNTSVEFYKKMFGVEPAKLRTGYAKFDLNSPSLNLTLNQSSEKTVNGALSHLGIQLNSTADVIQVKKIWEEAGLTSRDEMEVSCCYALQDKTWVKDPDGYEWEAFTVLEDNLPEFKFVGEESSVCCGSGSCGI
jgi:catechol 2,3-dioxygenase-like lactoylglutathione lyase family enzyme